MPTKKVIKKKKKVKSKKQKNIKLTVKDEIKLGRPKLHEKEKTVRLGVCLPEKLAKKLKADGKKFGGYGVLIRQAVLMMYNDEVI